MAIGEGGGGGLMCHEWIKTLENGVPKSNLQFFKGKVDNYSTVFPFYKRHYEPKVERAETKMMPTAIC